MNILMVFPFVTGKGGMETVITRILKNNTTSNNFRLFLPGGSVDEDWLEGISDKVICHHKRNALSNFGDTIVFILKNNPDVVISMSKIQIIAAWIAKKIFRRRFYLVSWNHFSLGETRFPFMLNVFRLCDYHLAISSGIERQLVRVGVPKDNISLVYNPVDPSNQVIPRSKGSVKEFIYVGRLQSEGQKNVSELINILGSVKQYKWHLTVIGTGTDMNLLKKQACDYQIDNQITWMGWQSNPWKCVKTADLLFLTSKFEGLPMILLEAMAQGIPCFSSNCPTGPEDIIQEGINGSLYDSGNIKQAHNLLVSFFEERLKYADSLKIQKVISGIYSKKYLQKLDGVMQKLSEED